jgi:hypothetical protein
MDLSQIGNIHIFRLPINISMLTTIRNQLWASIDQSPDINNLLAAHLVQCKRINRQPIIYLSALPHQLLKGNTPSTAYSSSQILGNHLLEHLVTNNHDEPTTQWQGAVNNQGYLYLQPSNEAIAAWLNQLLNNKNSAPNRGFLPTRSDSSITLQYIYIRCTQILQTTTTDIYLQFSNTEFTAQTISGMELIGAILDIWDHVLADANSTNISNRRIIVFSQQLVEQFLEFEKYCCMSAKSNQLSRNFNFGLIAIVQTTVEIILQKYWRIEPLTYW